MGDGTSGENRKVVVNSLVVDYGTSDEDDDDEVDESICLVDDDREQSNDPRIGRFQPGSGCTVWLISEDVFVTAGHCAGCGRKEAERGDCERWEVLSPVQDGFKGHIVEFEVPPSESNGRSVKSAPKDQYNVRFDIGFDIGKLQPERDTEWFDEQGVGNDWIVGRLLPNAECKKTAGEAQGCWFNLEFGELSTSHPIRITGHGVTEPRENVMNRVQKTSVGTLQSATSDPFRLQYQTDTTGADSGAPIINNETGWSIGVHTNGGCGAEGGSNNGMSNDQPMFKAAIQSYLGVSPENQARSPICPTGFLGKPPLPPPTSSPSSPPTSIPTSSPTSIPTSGPSLQPSGDPSSQPSSEPSSQPSCQSKSGKCIESSKSSKIAKSTSKNAKIAKAGANDVVKCTTVHKAGMGTSKSSKGVESSDKSPKSSKSSSKSTTKSSNSNESLETITILLPPTPAIINPKPAPYPNKPLITATTFAPNTGRVPITE